MKWNEWGILVSIPKRISVLVLHSCSSRSQDSFTKEKVLELNGEVAVGEACRE
jgi:hypothetical protein